MDRAVMGFRLKIRQGPCVAQHWVDFVHPTSRWWVSSSWARRMVHSALCAMLWPPTSSKRPRVARSSTSWTFYQFVWSAIASCSAYLWAPLRQIGARSPSITLRLAATMLAHRTVCSCSAYSRIQSGHERFIYVSVLGGQSSRECSLLLGACSFETVVRLRCLGLQECVVSCMFTMPRLSHARRAPPRFCAMSVQRTTTQGWYTIEGDLAAWTATLPNLVK